MGFPRSRAPDPGSAAKEPLRIRTSQDDGEDYTSSTAVSLHPDDQRLWSVFVSRTEGDTTVITYKGCVFLWPVGHDKLGSTAAAMTSVE